MIGLIGFNLNAKKESAPLLQQQTNDTNHLGTLRGPFTPMRPQQYFPKLGWVSYVGGFNPQLV